MMLTKQIHMEFLLTLKSCSSNAKTADRDIYSKTMTAETAMIEQVFNHTGLMLTDYCKYPKIWAPEKVAVLILKFQQRGFTIDRVMCPKRYRRNAHIVDTDQTTPKRAVWSGSTLFAQTYLSENLGSLWYAGFQCYTALMWHRIWLSQWQLLLNFFLCGVISCDSSNFCL